MEQKGCNEMFRWVFASMGVIHVPCFHAHFITVAFASTWTMKRSNNIQPSNAATWSPTWLCAVWNVSTSPFQHFSSPELHIWTILTCQRGKTTYYFPLHRSSRQLISFGSFLLGQIAVYACTTCVCRSAPISSEMQLTGNGVSILRCI